MPAARRASARSRAPHRSRSRSPRAWLVSSATRRSAPSTWSSGLDAATVSSWSRATARPSCSSRRRSWSNRTRARALSTRTPHPPERRHHPGRTGSQNPTGTEPKHHRDLAPHCWDLATILPARPACSSGSVYPWAYLQLRGPRLPPRSQPKVEDAGICRPVVDELLARCRRSGHPALHSGRGASSPNRNDNSTKRRPAVTCRTSCRCEQLNSNPAPAAGRYNSGPYSGKRS